MPTENDTLVRVDGSNRLPSDEPDVVKPASRRVRKSVVLWEGSGSGVAK